MGNYSTVYGKIWLQPNKIEEFKKLYNQNLNDYPKFDDMFLKQYMKHEKELGAKLHFNPLCNDFKLLGYPSYFDEFCSFFKNISNKILSGFTIIADVEDCSCFIFERSEDEFNLKLFRTDEGLENYPTYEKWHNEIIKQLS